MYIERMNSVPLQLVRYPSSSEAPVLALSLPDHPPLSHDGCCHNGRVHASAANRGALHFHKLRGFTFLVRSHAC